MRVADLLADAAGRLRRALGDAIPARLEAAMLLMHALDVSRTWLVAHDRDILTADQLDRVEALLARRLAGEPVAYILGSREFHGRPFLVSPAVLIPRPETEHLVEAALDRLPADRRIEVLDLGTGSGCIAITLALERPAWRLTATDVSDAALDMARRNGERLAARVEWRRGDLFAALSGRTFHLIVSNPPYVPAEDPHLARGDARYEPRRALVAGADGLEVIREIVKQAPTYLVKGGWLLLEHGYDQGDAVPALLREAGYGEAFMERDLAGQARVSGGRRPDA